MGKAKKWGIGIAVLLVLSFIGSMLPENKEKKVAEQQAAVANQQLVETMTALTQLPDVVTENGFTRDVDVSRYYIHITDTAPENFDNDLKFSQSYSAGAIQTYIDALVSEGINPKQEELTISLRLVTKEKSVTGNEQYRSFGRIVYDYNTDNVTWNDGAD
ncbi:hypothetical protein [Endozoicomonas sp. ALB115]|uniref:hypothetical protein n=1 Tax=Endozoicomonas sp. ALB115 TaxID=3403074 RepID=UPI003BB6164B